MLRCFIAISKLFRAYKYKIVFKTFQQLLFYFFFYTPKLKSIFTAMKHTIYIAVFFYVAVLILLRQLVGLRM